MTSLPTTSPIRITLSLLAIISLAVPLPTLKTTHGYTSGELELTNQTRILFTIKSLNVTLGKILQDRKETLRVVFAKILRITAHGPASLEGPTLITKRLSALFGLRPIALITNLTWQGLLPLIVRNVPGREYSKEPLPRTHICLLPFLYNLVTFTQNTNRWNLSYRNQKKQIALQKTTTALLGRG